MSTEHTTGRERTVRAALWLPGLLVALGAAVATAHGLYEVARAAAAPPLIAGLYPLITDGLALVAYAATARLTGSGSRYAWTVVVLAAGLSGLAQASYLAHGVHSASPALRFGVGAWPAIAAAIVAHLLYLIATAERDAEPSTASDTASADERVTYAQPEADVSAGAVDVQTEPATLPSEADERPTVQLPAVQANAVWTEPESVQPSDVQPSLSEPEPDDAPAVEEPAPFSPVRSVPSRSAASPARDKADRAAKSYRAEHGDLPTVARLMELTDVSRGTAGEALKALRTQATELHIVHEPTQQEAHR